MKNKRMVFGTMLFLFVLIGICNVINVSAIEVEMPPLSYYAKGFDVSSQDILEIYVSSSGVINIYIMNEEQLNILTDSGGLTWNYLKRWKDMTYLEQIYTIPTDGEYYVVLYNKNIFFGRTVDLQITIDYYKIYDPSGRIFLEMLIIFVLIGVVIIVVVILVRRHKKKSQKEPIIIREKEVIKIIYCNQCGEKIGNNAQFCSLCGAKQ